MRYLVIMRYPHGPLPVYERAAERGRMLPEGLTWLDSWIVDDDRLDRCFELVETEEPALLDEWLSNWRDIGEFEVMPVISSSEAAQRVGVSWQGGTGPA